jgi:glutamate formiminotransferase/formiminotetrahydrofolate cyclodeaminase
MEVIAAMAELGNPSSVSDAGVGALCARSAVLGAHLNVKINCSTLEDKERAMRLLAEAQAIADRAVAREGVILAIVSAKL